MTKEEAIAKYGSVECKFVSYYKYSFTFHGVAPDGAVVIFWSGGNSDDIYRYSVSSDKAETLNDNNWSGASIKLGETELWSDYRY